MAAIKTTVKLPGRINVSSAAKLPVVASVGGGGGNVDIIDQDLNVIASVTAPGSYSVLVFSGISGGAANTTFTNTIVGNP